MEMEAVVKPEAMWLLEDQAVLDGLMAEGVPISFPCIRDEFQETDMEILTCDTFQRDVVVQPETIWMVEDLNGVTTIKQELFPGGQRCSGIIRWY